MELLVSRDSQFGGHVPSSVGRSSILWNSIESPCSHVVWEKRFTLGSWSSVLLNLRVTTSPDKCTELAAVTECEEEGKKDKSMGGQKEEPHAQLIYGPHHCRFYGRGLGFCMFVDLEALG